MRNYKFYKRFKINGVFLMISINHLGYDFKSVDSK